VSAFGTDTNIDLSLVATGTGNITTSSPVRITNANAAVSTTTGALIVAGGVGIAGNISGNVAYGSQFALAGNVNTALTVTSLDSIATWKPVKALGIAAIDGTSAGIYVRADGVKAYVLGQSNDRVFELTLSTPYDITTASNVGAVSVVSQDGTARGVRFKPDGTKMYITGGTNTRVYEYTLSTPWQANTASNVGTFLLTPTVVSLGAYGIEFNTDGSKMYVGQAAGNVTAFTLSTPWSVNSASYSAGLTVSSVETALSAISFNSTGTQLMLYGSNGKSFQIYTLGTAYDLTTASYTGQLRNERSNQLGQSSTVGLHWLDTQNYFYITDYQADEIVQYQTNIGGVSLSSAGSTRFANTVVMDGSLIAGNVYTTGNIVTSGVNVYHYINGITTLSSLTAIGTVTFSTSASTLSLGTSQTTGNTQLGGTTQTGNLNIGPSTANITYWNWYGATTVNNTKNVIIGTGGLAGSFSNIQIGPSTGTGNVYFQSATQVNISNTQTSTSATTGALIVAGGVGVAGNVFAGGNITTSSSLIPSGNVLSLGGNVSLDVLRIYSNNSVTGDYYNTSFASPQFVLVPPQNQYGAAVVQLGQNPRIGSLGTDGIYVGTNASLGYAGITQLKIAHTTSAVNYVQVTGAATGNVTVIGTAGTDTNTSLLLRPQGTTSNLAIVANGAVVLSSGTGAITAIRYNALGSGYGSQPTVTISAPTTAGGVTAQANASIYFGGGTVVSGGTGYSVGDVLAVVGGSYTSQGYLTVTGNSSGVITSVTTTNGGAYYSFPANAVSVTGGTGSGATFNLLPGGVNSYNLLSGGSGYVEPPIITVTGGGGSGANAIARVGSVPQVKSLTSSLDFYTSNGQVLRLTDSTNLVVNYWQLSSSASGVQVGMSAIGGDTNIGTNFTTKGTSSHVFSTNSYGSVGLVVSHTASAVNYVQVTGAATGNVTVIGTAGTDANISLAIQPKGTGAIDLAAGSSGVNISNGGTVTAITRTAGGSGYSYPISVVISAPTTAGGIQATANAYAGAITTAVTTGGTGYTLNDVITVVGGTGTQSQSYIVSGVSGGAITTLTIQNYGIYTTPPSNPVSVTGGTGSSATLTLSNWSMTSVAVSNAGSGYVEQPTVTFSGGGGSGAAAYAYVGSGVTVKGLAGTLNLATSGGTNFAVLDSGLNSPTAYPYAVGGSGSAGYGVAGTATNAGITFTSKGTGVVGFYTNGYGSQGLVISHTASAVNYVQVTGAATGGAPTISAQGSDSNINLTLTPKGTGNVTTANPVVITNANVSTSTTTGALIVAGGIGVGQGIYVGGLGSFVGGVATSQLTSNNSTPRLYNDIQTNVSIGGASTTVNILSTNASTSTGTGALVVAGGAGIAGNVNTDGNIVAVGTLTAANVYSGGFQVITADTLGYYGTPLVGGIVGGSSRFTSSEASTTANTGAIAIPYGGLGVAGNVFSTSGFYGNITGNILTPAQPLITTVGSLNGLTISSGYSISTPDLQATTIGVTGITASTLTVTGALTGLISLTLSGNVTSNTAGFVGSLYGTVQTAAQTRITSLGALTSLAVDGGLRLGITVANSFSTANAVISGGYINALANLSATQATITNFATGNAVISGGYLSGLANISVTNSSSTNQSSTTGVVTNFSTGNAQITGGNITGLANAHSINAYFSSVSTGTISVTGGSLTGLTTLAVTSGNISNLTNSNAQITGGNITGMTNIASTTEVATNFSTGNARITGGYINSVANIYATTGVVTNFSTGNAVIAGGSATGLTSIGATTGYIGTIYASTINAATIGNTGASIVGTIGTAAQTTITSVGTLTNLQTTSLGVGTAATGTSGEIRATNNITAYYSSDAKFKDNVVPVADALSIVTAIGSKLFDWTDDYITTHGGEDGYFVQKSDFGVIAQDVLKVFPRAVRTRPDGSLAVDYEKLGTLAFGAVEQLLKRVEALESTVDQLKK
jgi:hypothetical protein